MTLFVLTGVIDINAKNSEGLTALHLACKLLEAPDEYSEAENLTPNVELLVKYKADVNVLNNDNQTPLMFALAQKNLDAARVLVRNSFKTKIGSFSYFFGQVRNGANLDVKDKNGNNLVHTACSLPGAGENLLALLTKCGKSFLGSSNFVNYLFGFSSRRWVAEEMAQRKEHRRRDPRWSCQKQRQRGKLRQHSSWHTHWCYKNRALLCCSMATCSVPPQKACWSSTLQSCSPKLFVSFKTSMLLIDSDRRTNHYRNRKARARLRVSRGRHVKVRPEHGSSFIVFQVGKRSCGLNSWARQRRRFGVVCNGLQTIQAMGWHEPYLEVAL